MLLVHRVTRRGLLAASRYSASTAVFVMDRMVAAGRAVRICCARPWCSPIKKVRSSTRSPWWGARTRACPSSISAWTPLPTSQLSCTAFRPGLPRRPPSIRTRSWSAKPQRARRSSTVGDIAVSVILSQGILPEIGSRLDPKTLQDNIISAGAFTKLGAPLPNAPPRTVTVTLASGEVIKGTLVSVDDFDVTLTDTSGRRRTLPRHGAQPHVEIKNPLQAHLDLAREWDDRDIHNLTAFLVTQK